MDIESPTQSTRRNPWMIRTAVVVGGLFLAWTALWYGMALQTKRQLEHTLAAWAAPREGKVRFAVTYDDIGLAGFPTNITLRLQNPKMLMVTPAREDAVEQRWTLTHTGTLDLVTDYLGHAYATEIEGRNNVTIEAEKSLTLQGDPFHSSSRMAAKSYRDFMAWQRLDLTRKDALQRMLQTIGHVSLDAGKIRYIDQATGKVAMAQESAYIRIDNHSEGKATDLAIETKIIGSEIGEVYATFARGFMRAMPPQAGQAMLPNYRDDAPFAPARAGKQDIDLALRLYKNEDEKGKELRLDVTRMATRNNYYSLTMPTRLYMKKEPGEGAMKMSLTQDITFEATPAAAAEGAQLVQSLSVFAQLVPVFKAERLPELQAKLLSAMPNLSTLGPITFKIDADVDMKSPREGTVALRNFTLSHQRWGIEMTGKVEGPQQITLDLTCRQCGNFTHDVMSTATDLQDMRLMLDPEAEKMPLGDPLLAAIDGLLAQLATRDEAGNLRFALTTPAPQDIRLNDQPLGVVMMQAMAALQPFLAPPAR